MKTTVTELPESRVRVEAEVPPDEVEKHLAQTARQIGSTMRIPGFRKGKVPPPIVVRRVGREAVLDETVRDGLPRWYADAVTAARIVPIGDPDVQLGDLPGEGEPLTFSIEIGVRPTAKLGEYKGVEVGRREPTADDAAVEAEIEGLRERGARLETVERPAATGDFVVMDFESDFEGGTGRDQMLELGSGRLVPGFEEQLEGATAGESRTVTVTFPDDYGARAPDEVGSRLRGAEKTFAVDVKEVKEKRLPELDDDFAVDQAGFDSLEEMRADLRTKILEADDLRVDQAFREAVVDAVVANAEVEVPDALVEARARELWDRMVHSLSHQGINKEMYLQISGRTEEELLAEARPEADRALRREAVIAAVVEAESIEPADGDVLDALTASAERENTTPEKLRARLEQAGRIDELRSDLAHARALDMLVEQAKAISVDEAKAAGRPFTPDPADDEENPDA